MDLPVSTVNKRKNDVDPILIKEAPNIEVDKSLEVEGSCMGEKSKGKVKEPVLKTIPKPRTPYPQIEKIGRKQISEVSIYNEESFCEHSIS